MVVPNDEAGVDLQIQDANNGFRPAIFYAFNKQELIKALKEDSMPKKYKP